MRHRRAPDRRDDPELIARAAAAAAASCDLLIIIAGASHGRDDYTAQVIKDLGVIAVHGVAIRPGHPVMLGVIGSTPVLGAPGYPVSAALSFEVFAAPLLARLEGSPEPSRQVLAARLARDFASPVDRDEWVRVQLRRVHGELVTDPLPRGAGALSSLVRADGLLLVPAGVDRHAAGSRVEVELCRDAGDLARTIALAGSDDLALDLAASALQGSDYGLNLALSRAGRSRGWRRCATGHAISPELPCSIPPPECTDPAIWRECSRAAISPVPLSSRSRGLIVAAGNPLGLGGIKDLAESAVRYVNRQPGSTTRALLDRELARLDIPAGSVRGYRREAPGHLGVAASVVAGRSECGLGLKAAAQAYGLGFVPFVTEPYEIVLETDFLDDPLIAPLWELLASASFQAAVAALGGYETSEMGRRVL